jgi:hypothetical protein
MLNILAYLMLTYLLYIIYVYYLMKISQINHEGHITIPVIQMRTPRHKEVVYHSQ